MPDPIAKLPAANDADAASGDERYRLDEMDRTILRMLQEDGRRQYGSIARELGVSDGAVRNRIMQMI